MKLANQLCTMEQGKELLELGITAKPIYWHLKHKKANIWEIGYFNELGDSKQWDRYPAFSVAELGQMIGNETNAKFIKYGKINTKNWHWVDEDRKKASK